MPAGRRAAVAAVLALVAASAHAAPSEIKVFTDEIASEGRSTVETHFNASRRAGRAGTVADPSPQLMPEYSYGVWRDWELSLQLPLGRTDDGWTGTGVRAELQYVAPHDDAAGGYWGFNVELAHQRRPGRASGRDIELIGILGWRGAGWHLAYNPGLTRSLGGDDRGTAWQSALKVARDVGAGHRLGIEAYDERDLSVPPGADRLRRTTLYLAWDFRLGGADVNLGLGRAFADSPDRYVLKAIVEWSSF